MMTSCTWLSRKSRIGDANELGFLVQVVDACAAQVAHPGSQAADELVHHRFERSAIRHAAFDAFRHKFGQTVLRVPFAIHHTFAHALRCGIFEVFFALEVAFPEPCAMAVSEPMPRYALNVRPW